MATIIYTRQSYIYLTFIMELFFFLSFLNSRPINCIVAATCTLLAKFDEKASNVYGVPSRHSDQHLQKSIQAMEGRANNNSSSSSRSSSTGDDDDDKFRNLQSFLHNGNEINNDLTHLRKKYFELIIVCQYY